MEWILVHVPLVSLSRLGLILSFSKEVLFFINSSKSRRWSLLIFEIKFQMPLCLRLFKTTRNERRSIKIKWIIQLLSMKKIFQWFIKTMIMTITTHRVQAGWRDRLRYPIPPKQHQPYAKDKN